LDLINHRSFGQEFFIDLLSSAATKRDAKAYITRLKTAPSETREKNSQAKAPSTFENQPARPEVNLGTFFGHARAVQQSPKFAQSRREEDAGALDEHQVHHLAIVKLVEPENIDDAALQGIGLTLSQLCRLSMTPCVVLECGLSVRKLGQSTWRQEMTTQANRLERAIHISSGAEARVLDNVFTLSDATNPPGVFSRRLLMAPIKSGRIPVILPLAYSDKTQTMRQVSAHQAILALAREFAGLNVRSMLDDDPASMTQRLQALQKQTSLDRLIILDPQGGIPHPAAAGSNHVFLNIEQEYHDVRKELLNHMEAVGPSPLNQSTRSDGETFSPSMSGLHPMSRQANREQVTQDVFTANQIPSRTDEINGVPPKFARHLENLDLLKDVLAFIPPSSSAIVTTPLEAARSSKNSAQKTSISAVGTRTQKNPLIHNLLTDKPPHSASLPIGRLGRSNDAGMVSPVVATPTFVKRGMPLTIIPDPRTTPWIPPLPGEPRLKLTDPRIDLSRLVHLIDDSFNRKLDVEHYLHRVNDRIAGLVIAGEYEGGALFTWETPPKTSPSDLPRLVPYLDKFAVLKQNQGAGGVADIVFNAMVRGCFPNGVCWRSRRDNPVNKWYFERARGTWKLPGTNWTMFWTTEGVEAGVGERFKDYEAVCRAVEPSWADKKKMAD
jgi:amino-acid N-acetyltransferase